MASSGSGVKRGWGGRLLRVGGPACLAWVALVWGAAAWGPAAARSPAPQVQTLVVSVGTQRMLPLPAMPQRVAVGDPAVADVEVLAEGDRGEILLSALKPGLTEVQAWMADGRQYRWRVQVPVALQEALRARGQAPQAQVDVVGEQALVTGQSSSLLSHRRAAETARSAGGAVADLSSIGAGQVVQVEVKVVELSRNVMKDAGVRWAAGRRDGNGGLWSGGVNLVPERLQTGVAGLLPGALLSDGFSLMYNASRFLASLSLLEGTGMARVLAEPTLVALSGQSASFLAGGEIPVPLATGLGGQSVEYKPFGIALTVSPTVLAPDRIALKVAPEASELDYTNAIPVVSSDRLTMMPALRTRRADTMVELGDGESFVISGLVSRQTMANVNKMPFLGDVPIIGAFFRNLEYSQEERELVIVVTPRLVRPLARGAALPLPGERQERRDSASNAWGHYLMGVASRDRLPGFSR